MDSARRRTFIFVLRDRPGLHKKKGFQFCVTSAPGACGRGGPMHPFATKWQSRRGPRRRALAGHWRQNYVGIGRALVGIGGHWFRHQKSVGITFPVFLCTCGAASDTENPAEQDPYILLISRDETLRRGRGDTTRTRRRCDVRWALLRILARYALFFSHTPPKHGAPTPTGPSYGSPPEPPQGPPGTTPVHSIPV